MTSGCTQAVPKEAGRQVYQMKAFTPGNYNFLNLTESQRDSESVMITLSSQLEQHKECLFLLRHSAEIHSQ